MTNQDSALAVFRLLGIRGVGSSRLRKILEFARRAETPLADLLQKPDDLRFVLSDEQTDQLRSTEEKDLAVWMELHEKGVAVLSINDDFYPNSLRTVLGENAPPLLFVRGNLSLMAKDSLGFCGSRKATEKGLQVAHDCALLVTQSGVNIVSGYAAGVDATTHRAALETGGTTTIVLAEGILNFRLKKLFEDSWDWNRVLVVSEFLPIAPWSISNAMQRNRTICSFCKAMVLIEAGETGGSIEAGRTCLKLGIPLFAPVYEGMPEAAKGNFLLQSEGARSLYKRRSTQMPNLKGVLAPFNSNLEVAAC